ncbi:endolytic transglycosylase MltG, partial [Streptomyces sp. SID11233]|nr:endolytic transglycosylase MltG [Streptomyces sp. SID11233]
NPGEEAFAAALNPTKDGWLYFVAVDGKEDTQFAKTLPEFKKLEAKFNASDAGR